MVDRWTPAAAPEHGKPEDAVEVGRVLGAWGVRGGLKVKPLASDPQALFSSKRWYLEPPELATARPPAMLPQWLKVIQAKRHGETILVTAQDLGDRDAADALKGARVFVSRASFPTPASDEFYWVDLIGLNVRDRSGRELGRVIGLFETGPHCVLRIRGDDADGLETMIPFVEAYVDQVDLPGRLIGVDWPLDDT